MNTALKTALLIACAASASQASALQLDLDTRHPGAEIPSTMYGIFFEDINYGADGGLYAEKVKNRSFEFPAGLTGWSVAGDVVLHDTGGPFERNPRYVTLQPAVHPELHTMLENEGFFGIAFEAGKEYRFSLWARTDAPGAKLKAELVDPAANGETQIMAAGDITVDSRDWKRYEIMLRPDATVDKGRLRVFLCKPEAAVDVEHISLMPADTWKGRPDGMRADLAQRLADLRPGVFRFPGGCIVEGRTLDTRYNWKNTVGPVENRPLNENRWQSTFHHRFFPDYYQTYGLGFYEFFELSEDIGAEPLPIINVGLSCQYQNHADSCHIPVDSLGDYIQDALDLIEFANGPATSTWGAVRASMGHPEPFGLKFLGVGNEQWGPEYVSRLEPFVKAIRAAYPDIKIVGSSGPDSEGDKFDYLWPEMRRIGVDLVDEHFYRPEEWFLSQGARYDDYPRRGPKVFAGEYACHGRGYKRNHFNAALLEAAFMTGLERNADVVDMATYAPLFAHVEGWQWRPDLIWFDNLRSVPTSSYYVQQLYGLNRGTRVLRLTSAGKPVTGTDGLFASAVLDEPSGDYIVKAVNTTGSPAPLDIALKGLRKGKTPAEVVITTLHAGARDENSLDRPDVVKPVTTTATVASADWHTELPANTFAIYRFTSAK